ncbi:MAG: NAD(+) synthase [Betaproteobacteria bacterium TMED156]|nr:MAG: NAD(+) synthase [Betaproteobacteria bacterium TMED156]|tara:strand:+ start:508 stop:1287 length:780 start_codon:yes stop_codon:yes gene_type:complete
MLQNRISDWIKSYAKENNRKTLVVGISGGIDSAVVSTLCAMTKMPTIAVSMPINQIESQHDLSMDHGNWIENKFNNVTHEVIDLDGVYEKFWLKTFNDYGSEHAFANTKSRLRMVTLHQISGAKEGIVVGTGNKVEDFGVGFYTKYGDGGVDISPIADLMKSEVWQLGKDLGILQEIIDAPPTDGLWEDGRTDKDQLGGLSYEQMEKAMMLDNNKTIAEGSDVELLNKYRQIRKVNLHKMEPIPVFKNDGTTQTSDSQS